MIRNATYKDAAAIAEIYNYYVLNTVVTFEEAPVSPDEMQRRITDVQIRFPWLVFEENGLIIGYAYAGPWKPRSAYRNSVESSVYLQPTHIGKGIGRILYSKLINELRDLNIHAVIGGIAQPNETSIKLHENFGFKKIGLFSEVGWKLGRWVDVGYWELIF